jgi:hypothetical protein
MTSSGLAGKSTLNTLLQPTLPVNRNRAIAPPVFKNLTELTISISDRQVFRAEPGHEHRIPVTALSIIFALTRQAPTATSDPAGPIDALGRVAFIGFRQSMICCHARESLQARATMVSS